MEGMASVAENEKQEQEQQQEKQEQQEQEQEQEQEKQEQKEVQQEHTKQVDFDNVAVVLCDIEGTTTSIKFVKDVLFPYVRENLVSYLEKTWGSEQTRADVEALRQQWKEDKDKDTPGAIPIPDGHTSEVRDACVRSVLWQMDADRKATALKQLQGHMWRDAYESGAVKGHVYEDVKPALERWVKAGMEVHIYSSGSVAAQKLLFKYSEDGDMTPLLSGHYDTKIGGKMESESYTRIAKEAATPPSSILFLSDRIEECEAARSAGLRVAVSLRPGNAAIEPERLRTFPTITSFAQLSISPPSEAGGGQPAKVAKMHAGKATSRAPV